MLEAESDRSIDVPLPVALPCSQSGQEIRCESKGREGNSDFWCVEGSGIFQIIYGEGRSLPFLFKSPTVSVFETGQLRAAQLTEATAGARAWLGFFQLQTKGSTP